MIYLPVMSIAISMAMLGQTTPIKTSSQSGRAQWLISFQVHFPGILSSAISAQAAQPNLRKYMSLWTHQPPKKTRHEYGYMVESWWLVHIWIYKHIIYLLFIYGIWIKILWLTNSRKFHPTWQCQTINSPSWAVRGFRRRPNNGSVDV